MVPTKNRSNERFAAVGRLRKFVHTIQATYHNPTMAKKTLSDLLKDEWYSNRYNQLDLLAGDRAQTTKLRSGAIGEQPAPERKLVDTAIKHWVETYSPSKCDRYSYYRYVWMEGRRLRHRHIGGGNVDNPRSVAMKEKVVNAIATGETPSKIVKLISRGD